jgi:Tol biopolymer transport system component
MRRLAGCGLLAVVAWLGCEPESEDCFELSGTLVQATSDTTVSEHLAPVLSPDGLRILYTTNYFNMRELVINPPPPNSEDPQSWRDFALVDVPMPGEVRTPVEEPIDQGNTRLIVLPTAIPADDPGQSFQPAKRSKRAPSWHPDGEQFAGVIQNGESLDRVYVLRIDYGSASGVEVNASFVALIDDVDFASNPLRRSYFYGQPAFSPDGQWVAYSRFFYRPGLTDNDPPVVEPQAIYAYNLAEQRVVQVSPTASSVQNPAWSPSGTSIAFDANLEGNAVEVYTIDFDPAGSGPMLNSLRRLTVSNGPQVGGNVQIQVQSFDPTWLLNGKIVFVSTRRAPCSSQRGRNLWQMNADGSAQEILFFSREDDSYPSFDPAGSSTVVFTSRRNPVEDFIDQKSDLYLLRNF